MSSSDTTNRVWFITGTSSGFGRELAEAVLEAGERVVATARRPEAVADLAEKYGAQRALALRLDVTSLEEAQVAVQAVRERFGRIDVVVNNAGYGTIGCVEEFSDAQVRAQMETHFFGTYNVLRAALPVLRAQRSGHILNVSSIGGFVAFPTTGLYSASKFAVEALSESLAQEVKPFGIRVTIVEPGSFRTSFAGGAITLAENRLPDYAATTDGFAQWLAEQDGKQAGDPRKAAAAMRRVVDDPNPPLRLLLGADALGAARQKMDALKADFDAWESVTKDTAFPGAAVESIGG